MSNEQVEVSVVIPARDEEGSISAVVEGALEHGDEVLVVDGHSKDRTARIARELGARVYLDHGLGKGDGYRVGLEQARGRVVVFLDGDGSHETADIPKLAAPILADQLDLVIASRWRGGSDDVHPSMTHFIRDLGGNFLSMSISWRFKVEVTDCLNGFRAIHREKALALGLEADDFDIEHEMVMKAIKAGLRLGEVPSHEYARRAGVSKLPTFSKSHIFFIRLFKEWW